MAKKAKPHTAPLSKSPKESILEAFLRLCERKGVANVVLKDIATEAGVAFGTVRYHFAEDDRDLHQEALIYLVQKAYASIESRMFEDRARADFNPVHSYVDAMFSWIDKNRAHGSFLVYYYYLCTTHGQLAIPNSVFLHRARTRVEALIHEAVGRKLYREQTDVVTAALKIHTIVTGSCLIAGTVSEKKSFDGHRAHCKEMADLILHSAEPVKAKG